MSRLLRAAVVLAATAVTAAAVAAPPAAARPRAVPPVVTPTIPRSFHAADPATDPATAYQQDANHDGYSARGAAAPPLARQWARDLGGAVSYPVIANGMAFVTVVTAPQTAHPTSLYALDLRTGATDWGPVPLPGPMNDSNSALAYGNGTVYAQSDDGTLTAFTGLTGAVVWSVKLPGDQSFTTAPTYFDGTVYTAGGSTTVLFAVDAATGAIRWNQLIVGGGQNSSPAVTDTGVYVAYSCEDAYRFDPATGTQQWRHRTNCTGGGGFTPVLADGALWIRDFPQGYAPAALNLSDGTTRSDWGTSGLTTPLAPAFHDGTGYVAEGSTLQARSTADPLAPLWTFTADSAIQTAPIIVNGFVYVASGNGTLYAVDPATGTAAWSTALGSAVSGPGENWAAAPLTGLAAAQGHLLVPATNTLVSYG